MTFKKAVILGIGFKVGHLIYKLLVEVFGWFTEICYKRFDKTCAEMGLSTMDEIRKMAEGWPFTTNTKKRAIKLIGSIIKK